ncbi:MAG: metallophosphoesterase [Gemmatimonadaceae bacterium]|nr:metallophosphoesterase [Gemmatimonadaceae bacterium]MDQ3520231.1 metallophosphoesterase [Gemmatimonadota bacterium]
MTTVLHVSDLHFGKPAVPEQIERIEEFIQKGHFDVVAISGDLSQRALSGEMQRGRSFIRDAERVSRTIVVPGNHDVRWWMAPLGIGNKEAMYKTYRAFINPELETVLRVPGVTFVGLNTAHGVALHTLTWNYRDVSIIGDLRVGQIDYARRMFDESPGGDARVIVMHHNPMKGELSKRHGMVDTKRVLGAFADLGVDVVLCGHDHQEAIHYVEHTRRGTVISTAGTVSNRSRGGRPSSLNIIKLRDKTIDVITSVWSPKETTFVRGPTKTFKRG